MEESTWVILLLALGAVALFIYRDIKEYPHFKSLTKTEERQNMLKQWLVLSFSIFGVGGVLGLWAIGQIDALFEMPDLIQLNLNEIADEDNALVRLLKGFSKTFGYAIFFALILSPLIQLLMQKAARQEEEKTAPPKVVGDIEPLLPRNKKERVIAIGIALNAGFSEEIFFRLLLFICLTAVSGNIWVGIIGSTLLFGITHYYQGWSGVIGTTVFGAICMFLYLLTQSIWVPIALHVILDINALLLMPLITRQQLAS